MKNRFTNTIEDENCPVVNAYCRTAPKITQMGAGSSNWNLLLIDRQTWTVYIGAYAFINLQGPLARGNDLPLYIPFHVDEVNFRVLDGRRHSRERYSMLLAEYLKHKEQIM